MDQRWKERLETIKGQHNTETAAPVNRQDFAVLAPQAIHAVARDMELNDEPLGARIGGSAKSFAWSGMRQGSAMQDVRKETIPRQQLRRWHDEDAHRTTNLAPGASSVISFSDTVATEKRQTSHRSDHRYAAESIVSPSATISPASSPRPRRDTKISGDTRSFVGVNMSTPPARAVRSPPPVQIESGQSDALACMLLVHCCPVLRVRRYCC